MGHVHVTVLQRASVAASSAPGHHASDVYVAEGARENGPVRVTVMRKGNTSQHQALHLRPCFCGRAMARLDACTSQGPGCVRKHTWYGRHVLCCYQSFTL